MLLSAESSFYILDTSPLSDICFADIFYKSVACLFIFVIVSLEEQKIFILILFNLPIFYAWPFLYPGPEFEPRSVGSKVHPFVTFSIMFPQNLSSDQCQAGTPKSYPGNVLKIQSPGSPPWGICFSGPGMCICNNSPGDCVIRPLWNGLQ